MTRLTRHVRRADHHLLARSHRARSVGVDRAFVTLTTAANYSGLWLAIGAGVAVLGGARGRRAAASGALAVAIAATVANGPVKLAVRRRRPPHSPVAPLIAMPRSTSFPSGHSAAAFAFAAGASAQLPPLAAVLMPLAGAVAYSRVHVGVHFPSDVLIGSTIGLASGAVASRLLDRRSEAQGAPAAAAAASS